MITKINHIGIVVGNIDLAMKLYTDVLGLKIKYIETMAERKIRMAMIPVGESIIELIECNDPTDTIAQYFQKNGAGIHHMALEVDNIVHDLRTLKQHGISLIDEEPKTGAGNSKIAFLDPKSTEVIIELVEP